MALKTFVFGKQSIGDKIVYELIEKSINTPTEYMGSDVDLSKIKPVEENLIIIINSMIYNVDLFEVMGYVRKDLSKPLVGVKKIHTFGSLVYGENLKVDQIITNKVYVFAGIFYLPKAYLKNTISEIFKTIKKEDLRSYIIFDKKNRG